VPGAGGQRSGFGRRGGGFGGFGGGALTFAGTQTPTLDPKLLSYLSANQHGARFLVATTSSSYASLFILQSDQPAMALGGYQGWDHILTPQGLAQMVAKNTVRFFYIPAGGGGSRSQGAFGNLPGATPTGSADATADLTQWVRTNCAAVPTALWQSTSGSGNGSFGGRGAGGQALYSCAGLVQR
jgi:hypothetical protein